jgi:pimeloyl-ACP methyl ester carboxylesterase
MIKNLFMTVGKVILITLAALIVLLAINYLIFRGEYRRWKSNPDSAGNVVAVDGAQIFYNVLGSGSPLIILESGLGSSHADWASLQNTLSQFGTALAYDRGEYGYSQTNNFPRTYTTISQELAGLLRNEHLSDPIIYVGHSIGAQMILRHALTVPNPVLGLILIDPAPYAGDNVFEELSHDPRLGAPAQSFARSLIDQRMSCIEELPLTSGVLYRLYTLQHGYSGQGCQEMIGKSSARMCLAVQSEMANELASYTAPELSRLADIPLIVITNNRERLKEILIQSGLTQAEADIIIDRYHEGKLQYLELSRQSRSVEAMTAEHALHLTEPELIVAAVQSLLPESIQ